MLHTTAVFAYLGEAVACVVVLSWLDPNGWREICSKLRRAAGKFRR